MSTRTSVAARWAQQGPLQFVRAPVSTSAARWKTTALTLPLYWSSGTVNWFWLPGLCNGAFAQLCPCKYATTLCCTRSLTCDSIANDLYFQAWSTRGHATWNNASSSDVWECMNLLRYPTAHDHCNSACEGSCVDCSH